jgi:hypothetical protein
MLRQDNPGGGVVRRAIRGGFAAAMIHGMLVTAWPFAVSQESPGQRELKLGEVAPDFALRNIEGKKVSLKDYRGRKQALLVFYPALFRAGG